MHAALHDARSGLPDGRHTLYIRATDYAGNTEVTVNTQVFYIDTTAPQTKIREPAPFTAPISFNDLQFSFVAFAKQATFECRVDAAEWAACSSPKFYENVPDGSHVFEVRALDPLGNPDETPDTRAFTINSRLAAGRALRDGAPDDAEAGAAEELLPHARARHRTAHHDHAAGDPVEGEPPEGRRAGDVPAACLSVSASCGRS